VTYQRLVSPDRLVGIVEAMHGFRPIKKYL